MGCFRCGQPDWRGAARCTVPGVDWQRRTSAPFDWNGKSHTDIKNGLSHIETNTGKQISKKITDNYLQLPKLPWSAKLKKYICLFRTRNTLDGEVFSLDSFLKDHHRNLRKKMTSRFLNRKLLILTRR